MKINRLSTSIVITGFIILFLELALIRFIPAYVININYYTNFILMACFLGIGIGLILGKNVKDYYLYLPGLLFVFILLISFTRLGTNIDDKSFVVLQKNYGYSHLPGWFVIGLIFSFITLIFITLGQRLGILFTEHKNPLYAYSWDLVGSLLGIATFFIYSLLSTSPVIWFITFSLLYIINLYLNGNKIDLTRATFLGALIILVFLISRMSIWSPYYKIDLLSYVIDKDGGSAYELFVNDIGHQNLIEPVYKEFVYFNQYRNIKKDNYENALIIGAGGGNDVAIAIENGVKNIDAVEIDPKIIQLGQELHPSKPYSNPNVKIIVNDGRNYLNGTEKKYDMIIFALTDSLTQVSNQGAIRLESYLFTQEAFKEAKEHLNDDGILVLYNYYRKDWLISKIGNTLESTFNQKPYVVADKSNNLASFIVSPQELQLSQNAPENSYTKENFKMSTDDWPFIYLQKNYLPFNYLIACFFVILFSSFLIWFAFRSIGKSIKNLYLPLFFTGAAFMLLETTALARFALIFGSTWIINSFVFFGIILLALCANLIMAKFGKKIDPKIGFSLLIISLLLYFMFPFNYLLGVNIMLRYTFGIILATGPIFFAGITFSSIFQNTKDPSTALGSNLLGAIFGGILEYMALITGYKFLIIISLLLYVLGIVSYYLKKKYS